MDKRNGFGVIALLFLLVQSGCGHLISDNEDFSAACLAIGMNPHPVNCWKYLICERDIRGELVAQEYSCPDSQVYSQSEQKCVPEGEVKDCKAKDIKGDPECDNSQLNCQDCSTLAICAKESDGSYHLIGNVSCTGTTKYCDNVQKKCTNVQPIQCVPHTGCTSEGIFPNIHNCSIYYDCKTVGGVLKDTVGVCEKGTVFNWNYTDSAKPCHHRDRPEDCITVKCNGTLETKAYHEGSPYSVLCTPNGDGYVFSCGHGNVYLIGNNTCKTTGPGNGSQIIRTKDLWKY